MHYYQFTPSAITVEKGKPVTIKVQNQSSQLHDFTVQSMPAASVQAGGEAGHHDMSGMTENMVHVAADGGKTGGITFTPSQSGTYTYVCTVAGHAEAGMTGTLVVQ